MMAAKRVLVVVLIFAMLSVVRPASHAPDCRDRVVDDYHTAGSDVILGVLQSFYGSDDGETCSGYMENVEIYDAIKLALHALPAGMAPPSFHIGVERYDSCGIPSRAVSDATHYAGQSLGHVNATGNGNAPCLDWPMRPGMVGPYTNAESLEVIPTLHNVHIPSISHAATTPALTEHFWVFRTVASDSARAQALVEFLSDLSWTYVHLVYSRDSHDGAVTYKKAAKGQIDLASTTAIPSTGADYNDIISQLITNQDAKVVVFWGSFSDLHGLLSAIDARGGPARDLQIVAGDYKIPDDVIPGNGYFSVAPGEYYNTNVQNYLMANNFTLRWGHAMTYVPSAIDATHVYVDALRRAQSAKCGAASTRVCDAMKTMDQLEFVESYLQTVDFTGISGRRIAFDEAGDPMVPAFEIRQVYSVAGSVHVDKVGDWTGPGTLELQNIQFRVQSGMTNVAPSSSCSSDTCSVVYDYLDTFYLAGIFNIHESDCSTLKSHHSGVDQMEAMLWAMDQVNKDYSIMPGIQMRPKLGESCSTPEEAAASTFDIVSHFDRQPNQAFGHHQDGDTVKYLAGVISHVDDEQTVVIEHVLQPLGLPQVSDTARLPSLSNKAEHPYFSRMIAPSSCMVAAIIEFLKEHDLTYVQVTQSNDGIYNTTAVEFIEKAKANGICIAQSLTLRPTTDFNNVVDHLLAKPSADIIITFTDEVDSQLLFSALERRDLPGEHLQMIYPFISDTNYLDSSNRAVHTHSITLDRQWGTVDDFVDYFASLTPHSKMENGLFAKSDHHPHGIENTWFAEYWMHRFQCQLSGANMPHLFMTPCTGMESLRRSDVHSTSDIINAVYVYAHALTNLQRDKCPQHSRGACDAMTRVSPLEWTRYIREVRFLSPADQGMHEVYFDEEGDAPSSLNILGLGSYLDNQVVATYEEDNGLVVVDNRFPVGEGRESTCRGACYECSDSQELGGTYLRIPGDFDVTAVLWLSEEGEGANLTCGATRPQETMAIEIIKYALDEINNSSLILPGIKLGLTIVDSCGQYLVTARQLTALIGRTATNLPPTGPMLGILGPVREYLQGHVASDVTSPFYIPTIGFTPASPSVFSDDGPYPASSLYSTAPAYDNEAVAVADILRYKGWNHVVFVYSHSYYGHAGRDAFNSAARAHGICVRDSIGIDLDSPPNIHADIVQMIRDYGITVVVAFVESTDARNLLIAEMESSQEPTDKITWVGSDKWFTDPSVDVTAGLESVARGAIVVTNYIVDFTNLKEHLSSLDVAKETKENPWLYNYVTDELTNGCTTRECLQKVNLGKDGVIPAYAATLLNAVHVLGQAVHNKVQFLCGNEEFLGQPAHVYKRSNYHTRPNTTVPLCAEFFEASWHELLQAVNDVYVFEAGGRRPFWFENRQGPAEYSIINFQGQGSSARFVPVGEWISGELSLDDSITHLYNDAVNQPIEAPSECPSQPSSCPTQTADGPYPSGWLWLTGMESWSIIILIVTAIVGLLCAAAIVIFIGRRNHPIIKSSNPFLMCMLSLGIILMYLNNIWYQVSPVDSACGVRRWMTGFSYSVVYAVLMTKTLCAMFLARADSATKTIFNSFPMMHIVLFCVLLGAEVILVTEWLILDPPAVAAVYKLDVTGCEVFAGHMCSHDNASVVVSMIYVYILVLATLVMSFFSSNSLRGMAKKENKYHLLTSLLSTCFLVAWGCCYTLLPQMNYQTPAILIGITVDATAIFFCTIVPKLLAFFNGDEDDMSQASSDLTEIYKEKSGSEFYKEKSGFENKGAAVNEEDNQTPL